MMSLPYLALVGLVSLAIPGVFGVACDWLNSGSSALRANICNEIELIDDKQYEVISVIFECDDEANSGTLYVYLESDCTGTLHSSEYIDFDILPYGVCNSNEEDIDCQTLTQNYKDYDGDNCNGNLEAEGSYEIIKETQCVAYNDTTSYKYTYDGSIILNTYSDDSCQTLLNSIVTLDGGCNENNGDSDSEYYSFDGSLSSMITRKHFVELLFSIILLCFTLV